jgi:dienelactone hydrolase
MKAILTLICMGCLCGAGVAQAEGASSEPEVVHFRSQDLDLAGELFKPKGEGPFPAVLYNHGSAPGMLNSQASRAIGPLFAAQGWVFFMPYRRGQGLSAQAGPYIGDQIAEAQRRGGMREGAATLTRLLGAEHLQDQLAALQWLLAQQFVQAERIAVAGNSFGGIEAVLGTAHAPYCAAVDASGGAESWAAAPELQALMKDAVQKSNAPIFFFQAENDFDLAPSKTLLAEMQRVGKPGELKIYPSFGSSKREGHSFAYRGSATWFGDVLAFMQKHCARPAAALPLQPAAPAATEH